MRIVLLTFMVSLSIGLSSCDSWLCHDAEPGNGWEKKDFVFMVPFYPDSLMSDSLELRFLVENSLPTPEIIYSSTLDSFRITTDVKGSYFTEDRADTLWSPKYSYFWASKKLSLDYFYIHIISKTRAAQTPQCDLPGEVIELTRLKIEVPRQIRQIEVLKF